MVFSTYSRDIARISSVSVTQMDQDFCNKMSGTRSCTRVYVAEWASGGCELDIIPFKR